MPEGVGYGPQNTGSTGLGLNVIGDHCYAYSGAFVASETDTTRLSFTSGSYYVVGEIRLSGMVHLNNPPTGAIAVMTVKMNGQTVLVSKVDGEPEDMPISDVAPMIIPPYTEVGVTVDCDTTSDDFIGTVSVTGRIYGKVD
jgi:hypothetical protein